MTKDSGRRTGWLRWIHMLLFSLYSALLVLSANAVAWGFSWAIKLRIFYVSHRYPHAVLPMDDNYGVALAAFLLVWVLAAAIFLSVLLLGRFHVDGVILREFAGFVAIVGLPLVLWYSKVGFMLVLEVEVVILAACAFLYVYRKWPVSTPLSLFLLILHFGLWAGESKNSLLPGWILFWPLWHWVWRAGLPWWLVHPLLGFCFSVIWGLHVRRSWEK